MKTLTEKNLVQFIGKDSKVVPPNYLTCGVAFVTKGQIMYRFRRLKKTTWRLYEQMPILDYQAIQNERLKNPKPKRKYRSYFVKD